MIRHRIVVLILGPECVKNSPSAPRFVRSRAECSGPAARPRMSREVRGWKAPAALYRNRGIDGLSVAS